ncbi:MAG: GNAT family N-acetyltransferase [Oscillospiraceae bacterium]|jgi:ribosomal-protein-alanine N-acetyltransferase
MENRYKADLAKVLNNQNIQNYLRDGLPYPYTEYDAEEYIKSMLCADKSKTFAFAITAEDEDKVIGSISVLRCENIHSKTAEIGYYIDEPYWGKGYATNAVRQACRYVFENSDIIRIFAVTFSQNIGSCRVLEKAGFQYEGTLHSSAIKNGKIVDMKIYALIKSHAS